MINQTDRNVTIDITGSAATPSVHYVVAVVDQVFSSQYPARVLEIHVEDHEHQRSFTADALQAVS